MHLMPEKYYKKWLDDRSNHSIIHYASFLKPWKDPCSDMAEYWWQEARKS